MAMLSVPFMPDPACLAHGKCALHAYAHVQRSAYAQLHRVRMWPVVPVVAAAVPMLSFFEI